MMVRVERAARAPSAKYVLTGDMAVVFCGDADVSDVLALVPTCDRIDWKQRSVWRGP